MIIGDGDIGSVLPIRDDLLFFASGVSNSQETDDFQYRREYNLLLEQPRNDHIVYFSTLAVFYLDSQYTRHKKRMEATIKDKFKRWTIVRIGNIDWGINPNTLINYLRAHPEAEIKDEYRYIVTKEEFLHHIGMIPEWNCEYNITGRMMKVNKIKEEYAESN